MVFNNWRDFIDKLPYDCACKVRKFTLWEQRNEQRGRRDYLNKWGFPYSIVRCGDCNKYLGNKTIKTHKLNYRTMMIIEDEEDTIENYYCLECGDKWLKKINNNSCIRNDIYIV